MEFNLGKFLRPLTNMARTAAPAISAAAALSTGGQSAFLTRLATGAAALSGAAGPTSTGSPAPVAIDISPTFAQETPDSGAQVISPQVMPIAGGGIMPAMYTPTPMRPPIAGPQMVRTSGAIVPYVAPAAGALARILGLGGAAMAVAPMIIDPITGIEKKLRVTRKLRSDTKKAVEMFGAEVVAAEMGTTVEVIFYILTKKIRNDGPAVTKAALRKTRSTLRKLDSMCSMRDAMRPPARRATRRTPTTKVMQVKN
jgi:hypothetical protein